MKGQMNLQEYLESRKKMDVNSCGRCACKNCLYWQSSRCPYGKCYDDHQAVAEPYDQAHPGKPPRTSWSDWDKPGEQAH